MPQSPYTNTYIDEDNPYPQALSEATMEAGGFLAEDEEGARRRERIRALREDTGRMDWASQAARGIKGIQGGMEQNLARKADTAYSDKLIGVGKAAQARARGIQALRHMNKAQNRMALGSGVAPGLDMSEYDMSM